MQKFNKMKKIINKIITIVKTNNSKEGVVNVEYENSKTSQYFNTGAPPLEQNTEEIYDKFYSDCRALEEYYVDARLNFYKNVVEKIIENEIDLSYKKILDIGCGNGHLLNEINNNFNNCILHGSDFSMSGIEYARKIFPQLTFYKQNIYDVIDNEYDVILCTEVLEHLEYPERALKNMLLSLKSGGILILTVPDGRIDTIEEHINFWSPESWYYFIKRESDKNSFIVDKIGTKCNMAIITKVAL